MGSAPFFDTVRIEVGEAEKVAAAAVQEGINLRVLDPNTVSWSCMTNPATTGAASGERAVISPPAFSTEHEQHAVSWGAKGL